MTRAARCAPLAALALAACALPDRVSELAARYREPPPAPASLLVELAAPYRTPSTPNRVEIALVADSSVAEARQLVGALRRGTEIGVRVAGHRSDAACDDSERRAGPTTRARDALAALRGIEARSDASVAALLDAVRADLARDGAAAHTRVVLFADASEACGDDPCGAARRLVADGAWLEVVLPAGAVAPSCLAELVPSPAAPPRATAAIAAPVFSVTDDRDIERADLLAVGRAGRGAVGVRPGEVFVVLHVDPPATLGPMRLEPGTQARLRVAAPGRAPRPFTWRLHSEARRR